VARAVVSMIQKTSSPTHSIAMARTRKASFRQAQSIRVQSMAGLMACEDGILCVYCRVDYCGEAEIQYRTHDKANLLVSTPLHHLAMGRPMSASCKRTQCRQAGKMTPGDKDAPACAHYTFHSTARLLRYMLQGIESAVGVGVVVVRGTTGLHPHTYLLTCYSEAIREECEQRCRYNTQSKVGHFILTCPILHHQLILSHRRH
jgi:hypothetical protein